MKTVTVKAITYITGIICVSLLLAEQGFVISTLWDWFAVPLGAPVIGVAVAVGLAAVGRAIRGPRPNIANGAFEVVIIQAIQPVLCLAVGFIAKQFV